MSVKIFVTFPNGVMKWAFCFLIFNNYAEIDPFLVGFISVTCSTGLEHI